jgi:pSer/pThr/pTyr-binding forkhead associated (FHA) protein
MAQFQIVVKKGPEPGKIFLLSNNEVVLGRDVSSEIALNDAEISRSHCKFTFQGGGYSVEDMGSTNGTMVNNQPISAAQMLRGGDKVKCGDNVVVEYQVVGGEAEATIISHGGLPDPAKPSAPTPPPPVYSPPPVAQKTPIVSNQPARSSAPKNDTTRKIILGCGIVLLFGGCVAFATLMYIDSQGLWCSVFGDTVCQGLASILGL